MFSMFVSTSGACQAAARERRIVMGLEGRAELIAQISRQRAGWSLDQAFYVDPAIFALERELWFSRQWMVIGHASEIPARGSYMLRHLFDEEIIVVRAGEDDIRAYYNVCTHRGSRLCKADGRAPLLVCPYHAWSFQLTGELRTRQDLPPDADPKLLGLREVPVRTVSGVILCGLDPALLPDPQPAFDAMAAGLEHHGVEHATIADRKMYPTRANWKLVLENFLECYHCRPSHPEYFSVNGHVRVTALRDAALAEDWYRVREAWKASLGESWFHPHAEEPGNLDVMSYRLYRKPIGLGRQTLSRDGKPVSRVMGRFTAHDGGETGFRFGRLSFMSAANDYVTVFQMIPRAADHTDVILTWLVDRDTDLDRKSVV